MTEEHLDRMVRDADPYVPDVVGHLDGAKQILLEEIMSEPTLDRVVEPPRSRRLVSRVAASLTAAAVLIGVLAVSAVLRDHPDERRAVGPAGTSIVYSPAAMKAAEENPRLLIDQSGWTATTVNGFAEKEGTIAFRNGGRQLEMNWYPADQYHDYYTDRLEVSRPESVRVDSWRGDLFRYSAGDFAVMLRPRDGVFVELRTAGGWTRDDFNRILTHVVRVDVRTWLAALPAEIVTQARADAAASRVLADVPLPPKFDVGTLNDLGTNDSYQFGAQVTGRVGCAWIAEWLRAKRAGDAAALQRATNALRGSHQWRVLHQMVDQGDWPEAFWEIADKVVAGHPPAKYAEGLGCV